MNVLVVGCGAREHALASRLNVEGHRVFYAGNKENPGLVTFAERLTLPKLNNSEIVEAAIKHQIHLVIPCTERALFQGVSNDLTEYGIPCFGPSISFAKLEFSKIWQKSLLKEIEPGSLVNFHSINSEDALRDLFKVLTLPIIVKGATADHSFPIMRFYPGDESTAYSLISEAYYQGKHLIAEPLLPACEEFSFLGLSGIQSRSFCFIMRDYPFLNNDNSGPKTGGMGSISGSELNATLSSDEQQFCLNLTERVISHLEHKLGQRYVGVIIPQFLRSRGRLYLSEFDVRFGDSEIINFLKSFDGNLGNALLELLQGKNPSFKTKDNGVVCICLAPHGYPGSTATKEFNLKDLVIHKELFLGDVRTTTNGFASNRGRSFVIVADAPKISEAASFALEKASPFAATHHFRTDIGSEFSVPRLQS